MKLSTILKHHGAYQFFIDNFDKEMFYKEGAILADIDHVDDSVISQEEWGKEPVTHPFLLAMGALDNEENLELDMNEALGIPDRPLVLVKFDDNWGDEMDIEGHFVLPEEAFTKYKVEAKAYFEINDELLYPVGSNEDIEYMSYDELMDRYMVVSITQEEYNVLVKLGLETAGFTGPEIEDY